MPETIIPLVSKVQELEEKPADRLNLIDRAVTFFSPEAGVRRMQSRTILHAFGYDDNITDRGRKPPLSHTSSETWAKNRDRLKMMADARDLATYDWIGGVIAKVVLYVAGRLHCKTNTGDEQVDAAYDDYFHGWCGDEKSEETELTRCDISGRHRFLKMVQLALMGFLVDGDHGFVEIDPLMSPAAVLGPDGQPLPGTGEFCLQHIEADRIGSPNDASQAEGYIGGVVLDPATGRIQAYRVFRRTRSLQYLDPQDVPSASFIHVFDPDKSDEYRGRTKLLRLLNDARDIREWIDAEKKAGKTQSQYAGLIGTKDPFNNTGATAWSGKTGEGTPTQDAVWGKLLRMAEGESFSMMAPPSRPSGGFMAFIEMVIRKMSVSIGLSYGLLWDITSLGGANTRVAVQSDLRQIQYWQNILSSIILHRVRRKVVAEGIAKQMLPPHPNWKNCDWHWGPHLTADLAYEVEADLSAIDHGIISAEEVMSKHGRTARDVFAANATTANVALQVGAEKMLPVESFARGLYPDLTNQRAAFLTPAPIPPPPPGTFEAIGDKGVAKMIEIFVAVGEGKIDRDSAIEQLVYVIGIPRSKAEKMVPDEPSNADKNRAAGLDSKGNHPPPAPSVASNGSRNGAKSAAKKPAGARK